MHLCLLSLGLFIGKTSECTEAVAPYFKWCPDLAAFVCCINRAPFLFREIR